MLGTNPIRKPVQGDGLLLDIQSIFATLQGEGIYAGWPAVFVRLGGCNLACAFCDTEFETFNTRLLADILTEIRQLAGDVRKLIVITGGEPFLQPIEKLCSELVAAGFKVQIETNGTLYRDIDEQVDIMCSPKNTGKGYFPIRSDLLARVNAFKFIISAHNNAYAEVGEVGQRNTIPVYVQPMDEYDSQKNRDNLKRATELAQTRGYRLSLQLHKIAGIE